MGEKEGELLRMACLTLKDMAEAVGVPPTTVRNWSVGRIEIPTKARGDLTDFLRSHAKRLLKLAEELEG